MNRVLASCLPIKGMIGIRDIYSLPGQKTQYRPAYLSMWMSRADTDHRARQDKIANANVHTKTSVLLDRLNWWSSLFWIDKVKFCKSITWTLILREGSWLSCILVCWQWKLCHKHYAGGCLTECDACKACTETIRSTCIKSTNRKEEFAAAKV